MKLQDLLKDTPYQTQSVDDPDILDLVYDSRKVQAGCLFVCLRGASFDGHAYAQQAVEQGAAAVLSEEPMPELGVPVILAENTRKALAELSAVFFGYPANELKVVGLTGTKGKTTTAAMIRSILEHAGHRTGTIGTLGVVIGDTVQETDNTTPESYLLQKYLRQMVDAGCEAAVIEASSIGLKAHRTDGIQFDYGVFSNFSEDHIGGSEHRDMEEYLHCKQLLFRQCNVGIVNIDDPSWKKILEGHTCSVETYGFSADADFQASDDSLLHRPGYLGCRFRLQYGQTDEWVEVNIPGRFSIHNALAAIGVCSHFGVGIEDIRNGLNHIVINGRVEPVPTDGDYTLLIDYAHNALSMGSLLRTLREYDPNRLICMFGAGGDRSKVRRYEMGEVSGRMADLSVITSDNSRSENVMDIVNDILIGMHRTQGDYVIVPDRREAIQYCIEHAQAGDIIVLAGKGHETYQEVNGVRTHFDEHEIVAEILQERRQARG